MVKTEGLNSLEIDVLITLTPRSNNIKPIIILERVSNFLCPYGCSVSLGFEANEIPIIPTIFDALSEIE